MGLGRLILMTRGFWGWRRGMRWCLGCLMSRGVRGRRFWELVPLPTVEGDGVGWITETRTVDKVTVFFGGMQSTNTITETKVVTQVSFREV